MTEAEFSTVVAANRAHMVNLAMQWTQNREAAEDVVQETLVELLDKYAAFELRERGVKTWLMTSLLYRVHDRHRREQLEVGARVKFVESLPPLPNAYSLTEYEVDLGRLLPPDVLAIVRAIFFEGLTYEQVAAELGAVPNSIYYRVQRALRAVAVALAVRPVVAAESVESAKFGRSQTVSMHEYDDRARRFARSCAPLAATRAGSARRAQHVGRPAPASRRADDEAHAV